MDFGQLLIFTLLIGAFVLTGFLVGLSWYFRHKRLQLWHETLRLALEKGQSAPSELRQLAAQPIALSPRRDIRTGIIFVAVAVGLWVFLSYVGTRPSPYRSFLAVPAFVGVALILHQLVGQWVSREPAAED